MIDHPEARLDASAARSCVRWFAATGGVSLTAAVLFVAWANVWGNYGDTGYFHVYNDRLGKVEALLAKPREALPEAWLIGGSTLYPFLPAEIEQRFDLRAYHLGTFWARVDEAWSWLNFIAEDLEASPELVVLGLDTWSFQPGRGGPVFYRHLRRRLLNAPELARHLDEYDRALHRASKTLDLLSGQQLRLASRAVRGGAARITHRPAGSESLARFEPDGSGPYGDENPGASFAPPEVNRFYSELLTGARDAGSAETQRLRRDFFAREIVTPKQLAGHFPGERFDPREIERFRAFVALCERLDADLLVILLPVHPLFDDLLAAHTGHRAQQAELRRVAHDALSGYRGRQLVFDATDLRDFDGDPAGFHDRNHMKPSNAARILDRVQQRWRASL